MPQKRTPLPAVALIALAAAAALPARAQSLQELYEAARGYDASYRAAVVQAQTADQRLIQAQAALKPTAALSAGASYNNTDLPRLGSGDNTTLSGALRGRYPIWNKSGAVGIDQAKKGLETARADLDTAEQDLILRVAQAYFDVLAAQDTLGTTKQRKAAITEQLASAKRNFEVGTQTITDTREAQASFDLATAQEIAAENDLRSKRIALDQLVGRQNVAPKPLLVPVVLPAVVPANPEEWVSAGDQQHPAVRKARVGLEVATLEIAKARAGESATLDAVGTLALSHAGGSSASLPGLTKSATVGVEFNLPLYTGGLTQGRIKETLLLEEKARNDLEAARRDLAQRTRVAYFNVNSGLAQVKALEAAESSSRLALEATQLGYRVGVRVNLDVLNAQTQLFTTLRDLARARYDVVLGGLRLRQASGQLAAGDVEAVNRLLAK